VDCSVAKSDQLRQIGKRDVHAAVVQDQQHLAVCHPSIEVPQTLQEDDLRHPGLLVAAILTAKVLEIDMAEAARTGVLANDPEGDLVGTIANAADSQVDRFLVLLPPLKLLHCK